MIWKWTAMVSINMGLLFRIIQESDIGNEYKNEMAKTRTFKSNTATAE
jgi:hypothetical protein